MAKSSEDMRCVSNVYILIEAHFLTADYSDPEAKQPVRVWSMVTGSRRPDIT